MRKIPFLSEPLQLDGLPWFQSNGNQLIRLPAELEDRVSQALWAKSRNTSGARIRFASDTTLLGIQVKYPPLSSMQFMHVIGQMGLDVYVDGSYWSSVWPLSEGVTELIFFEDAPRQPREITIYLPLYHSLEIQKIIIDDEASLAAPQPYQLTQPVVFYGTSITQGGSASRPGLSYQARLARNLNIDYINLGFSGLGKGEAIVAEAIAALDASCLVLDYGQNNEGLASLEQVYLPFIQTIRKQKPDCPILLTTLIPYSAEQWNLEFRHEQEMKREVIRRAFEACIQSGDKHIKLIEGNELLKEALGEGQVDGAHPNDLGFLSMSRIFEEKLSEILQLKLV